MPKKTDTNPQFAALSEEAKTLYERLQKEWAIVDGVGVVVLLTACQALDSLRTAQSIVQREGCIVADRFKQPRQHPATILEKESQARLLAALKALNLDAESLSAEKA